METTQIENDGVIYYQDQTASSKFKFVSCLGNKEKIGKKLPDSRGQTLEATDSILIMVVK